MNAEAVAKALGGRKAGSGWMACCPAHNDREPSLSIRDADDGKVLVRCHSGCDQGRVIAALRAAGLWETKSRRRFNRPGNRAAAREQSNRDDSNRTDDAMKIWRSAAPSHGTLVEAYLISRGLRIPPPSTLRFHGGLKHLSGGVWPAMVAIVTSGKDDTPLAIHRTFLARDWWEGSGRSAENDARSLPRRCCAARDSRRVADGGRRHRDLSRRNVGLGKSGLGSTVHFRATRPRSA
jgi:putative DNA primase/helicase